MPIEQTPPRDRPGSPRPGAWRWRCASEEEALGVASTLAAAKIEAWIVENAQGFFVESTEAERASALWHRLAKNLSKRSEAEHLRALKQTLRWRRRLWWMALAMGVACLYPLLRLFAR